MTTPQRRQFFKRTSAILGAAGLAGFFNPTRTIAQEPIKRTGESNMRLALAAYSLRQHFEFMKGKPQKPVGRTFTMFDFIDYCAKHHLAAELTSYFFPSDADEKYFLSLKRYAFTQGVPIVGTAIGNNFTLPKGRKLDREIADAKKWIDKAALLGAPHIRFFAGTRKQLEASPERMKTTIESLQTCVDYAASKGIFVGVENHGMLTADQVLEIVKGIKSDWFGVNLDTGNFVSEDPYGDLEKCAPFAVNVQLKVKMKRPDKTEFAADFRRLAKLLRESKYRGYVVLEFEEPDPLGEIPGVLKKLRAAFPV